MKNEKCKIWSGPFGHFSFFLYFSCLFLNSPALADLDSAAFEAYQVARNWVERGLVPEQTLAIQAEGVTAVHLTLRVQGWTVGQSTARAELIEQEKVQQVDLMPLVAAALSEALREARRSLATRGAALTGGTELTLDLQVGRTLEPLRLDSIAELPRRIVPHAHGLALSRDRRWAWSFPGNAVAANTDLDGRLNRLIADLDIPLARKASAGTADGPALFRFEVVHITIPVEGAEPVRLYRGHEVLPTEPLDEQALALLGEQWADYLVERQRDDGRFAGTYEPTADQYQPETADTPSTAMAAYALAHAAKLGGLSQPARAQAARRAADALILLIGRPDAAGRQIIGRDAEATAMTLLALVEAAPDRKTERDRLVNALRSLADAGGRFRTSTEPDAGPCSIETQALAAAALVAAYDATREPDLLGFAARGLAAAWGSADEYNEHRLMPWIALAEVALIRLQRPTEHRQRLVDLSQRMWERQVKPWGDDAQKYSPDAIGGFIIGNRLFDEPTADSAAVLAGLAAAMELAGEDERLRRLIGCGLAGRFMGQLTLQPSSAYYTRNPQEAIGGVRIALWDNRQPLRTTASALLAITELRQTLTRLALSR